MVCFNKIYLNQKCQIQTGLYNNTMSWCFECKKKCCIYKKRCHKYIARKTCSWCHCQDVLRDKRKMQQQTENKNYKQKIYDDTRRRQLKILLQIEKENEKRRMVLEKKKHANEEKCIKVGKAADTVIKCYPDYPIILRQCVNYMLASESPHGFMCSFWSCSSM